MPRFTKIEQKIMDVLKDGKRHTKWELRDKCLDSFSDPETLYFHLSNIRKKLPKDETILCVYFAKRHYYQYVRLIGEAAS